ncbi:Atxe2 family lasso peptide isopeptidase [Luteimonas saliphila]|uniref:Atxe2 family lasso peptide isopeptidase n=1 Tax=Luteimonas saliphila TaxID=2804919 RepID=UPI001EE15D75|nr:Atxe2 family lasso peptide isopeptidase [Luteimonas saliphila]
MVANRISKRLLAGSLLVALTFLWQAQATSPRAIVEMVDFNSPLVSPDGSMVTFRTEQASIEHNRYEANWYVQSLDGALPPRRVASGGVPLFSSAGLPLPAHAAWSPDGRWIYFRAMVDGKIDVWRAATDGSGAEPVTLDPADVQGFLLGVDGQVLKYSVGATREEVTAAELAEYDQGIHIDELTPFGQNLFRSGYTEGRLATQRLGNWWDRVPLRADVPDRWRAVDLTTWTNRELDPSDVPPKPLVASDLTERLGEEPWKLSPDIHGGRIAVLTRVGNRANFRDKPYAELAMLPSKGHHDPVRCQAELCTDKAITDIQWRPDGDEVLFTVTDPDEGLAQSIFRWNVRTGEVHPVAYSRGLISGEMRWTPGICGASSAALVCVAAEADGPPRLERIDLETGDRQVLFDPNAALARDMENTVRVRLLRWADAEGRQFTGQYFSAHRTGAAPAPLFVNYYRCLGFLRGGVGNEWPLAAMARNGISALCINSLPHDNNASARYDAGRLAVESVVELLAAEGEVDRTKVGMGGLSFGAETTLWTVIHSDLITVASVATPVISHLYYLLGSIRGDTWFFSQLQRNWQLGAPDETPEQWQKISPAMNLDKIKAPVLMQLSEQELFFSLDYAIPLIRNRRADVYVFPHEPHQKFQPRHKFAVYQRNLDWFRFWLQGFEDNDPRKAEQYTHWRTMRSHQCKDAASMGNIPWYCQSRE